MEAEVSYDIYVVRSDGTGLKRLTDAAGAESYPAWSPDGQRIAYFAGSAAHASDWDVWIMNADGSGLSAVPGVDDAIAPAWRPE